MLCEQQPLISSHWDTQFGEKRDCFCTCLLGSIGRDSEREREKSLFTMATLLFHFSLLFQLIYDQWSYRNHTMANHINEHFITQCFLLRLVGKHFIVFYSTKICRKISRMEWKKCQLQRVLLIFHFCIPSWKLPKGKKYKSHDNLICFLQINNNRLKY